MKVTMIGSGDAFGSGGRLQTCIHVDCHGGPFLIDCGATALIGLRRLGLDPNAIRMVLVTHLHGDHFSGLVWFLMHAFYVSRRTEPLIVAGPPGIAARVEAASEILFPKSFGVARRHALEFVEYDVGGEIEVGQANVAAFEVSHPSGAPSCALRVRIVGRTIAYSGDTEWVETLVDCGRGADLFITECYSFDKPIPYHLNWATLQLALSRIGARQTLLTHMSDDMLARADEARAAGVLVAEDGLAVDV